MGRLGDRIGHTKVLIASALAAMVVFAPQAWVQTTWQLILLQALGGLALGGLVPSVAALMNLWAPGGNQGSTYGLDNSVQASGRVIAPLIAATIAALAGYRGVFLGAAAIYAVMALAAVRVVRAAKRRATQNTTSAQAAANAAPEAR